MKAFTMLPVGLIVTVTLWALGFVLGRRLARSTESKSLRVEPAISIIIPARNEESNLPRLLQSILAQSVKPQEIIVVDDSSTDRTAEIARQLGARVIHSGPLPEGWRGKTWACHQGAQVAKGGLLLFMDADTWFDSEGLARILTVYSLVMRSDASAPAVGDMESAGRGRGGALSFGPFHAVRKLHEELSLFFNFNMTVGTIPRGLFGQLLLVDRESYRRVGGHEAVKSRTLENLFLAQQFCTAGIPTLSTTGRDVLCFRMYPGGMHELVEGWTKGFASGASQTPRRLLLLVVLWMIGLMLAPIGLIATSGGVHWGVAYLLCAAQVWWIGRQIGSFRWFTALLYPVPLIFFFIIFARSVWLSGKQVTWKGREIRAD